MGRKAFQDYFQENDCWGCGPNNENGLRLKTYWKNENKNVTISTFIPKKFHKAGPDHILNGGIIGTIIDCHGVFTAVASLSKEEGTEISHNLWHVTGTLTVKYLKPTPIDRPVTLIGKIIERQGKKVGSKFP